MPDRLPTRRPLGHPRSGERYPSARERIGSARRAAEALFAPKPRSPGGEAPPSPGGEALGDQPGPSVAGDIGDAIGDQPGPPVAGEIGAAQAARIRAWIKYGMSVAEVAELFGVPVREIEKVVRQP
jgi:hypothetical protein